MTHPMSRAFVAVCLPLLIAAACVTGPDPKTQEPAAAPPPAAANDAARGVDAAAAMHGEPAPAAFVRDQAPAAAPAPGAELSLWNDARFRRQVVESYMAESDLEPRTTPAEKEAMQTILDLIAKDQRSEALQLCERNRSESASAVFDFTWANLNWQAEQLDEAAAGFTRATDKHPRFRRAWNNLGLVEFRRGAFDAAIAAFTRTIEIGGGSATTYGLLGFAHSQREDHVAAEFAYRMAVLLAPSTMDWKMGLANSLFRQARFADAAALCGGLIAEDPNRTNAWLLQANAFVGLGQLQKAAENLEMVDRMGQANADTLGKLGDIYVGIESFDLAAETYLRAIAKGQGEAPERGVRAAKLLASRGALEQAVRLCEKTEQVCGASLEAADRKELLKVRARAAVAAGAGADEAKVLEEIAALDPTDGDALLLLGQFHARSGDHERAVLWYERAAGLPAFDADAKVRIAQVHVAKGRYAEALPLLRRAQTLKPRDNIQKYLEQIEKAAQGR